MENFDVVVVGGGCAGLWTSYKLSSVGLRVMLVEKRDRFGQGPSTRNGGYVHGGGFHSAVIEDEQEALYVAMRCQHGLEEFRALAPEAIIPDQSEVHLLAQSEEIEDRAIRRWQMIGLSATFKNPKELEPIFHGLRTENIRLAATVKDVSIDYRILYSVLLTRARSLGCETRLCSYFDPESSTLVSDGTTISVERAIIVYCTGVDTPFGAHSVKHWPDLSHLTLWKSHVLTLPRLYRSGFMFIDPGEISLMPQMDYSIACQSQDDVEVDACDYSLVLERVLAVKAALSRVVAGFDMKSDLVQAHACLKPSARRPLYKAPRSVSSYIQRISDREIIAFPGKATEAPLMATEVLHEIVRSHPLKDIAARPGDFVWGKK